MSTLSVTSNFIDNLLDRLVLCHQEIDGVNKVFKVPPIRTIDLEETPFVYFLVGPMVDKVERFQNGSVVLKQNITARLMINSIIGNEDYDNETEAYVKSIPFYYRFISYYIQHPRLQYNNQEFQGLNSDIEFSHSGLYKLSSPGNTSFSAIDFDLEIEFRIAVPSYILRS